MYTSKTIIYLITFSISEDEITLMMEGAENEENATIALLLFFFFFLIQFNVPFKIISAHMRRVNQ